MHSRFPEPEARVAFSLSRSCHGSCDCSPVPSCRPDIDMRDVSCVCAVLLIWWDSRSSRVVRIL